MNWKHRAVGVAAAAALSVAALGATSPARALAGSWTQYCWDNPVTSGGDDVPILTGEGGVWLAAEVGGKHLSLCISTANPQSTTTPEAVGEDITVNILGGDGANDPNTVDALCLPDSTANGVVATCQAATAPSASVSPGPAGTTGDVVTVNVPFTLCLGQECQRPQAGLAATGLLVGQLTPVAEPGIGAGYQLSSLSAYVNGIQVFAASPNAGAFVDPFAAIAENLDTSQGGPCLVGNCVPDGYVETTGTAPIAGVQLLGQSFPVTVPRQCVYSNPNGQCP